MQASIACSSRCGTRNPSLPEGIISGVAPIVLAMTGRPAPIVSITETGQASPNPTLGSRNASASDSSLRTSVLRQRARQRDVRLQAGVPDRGDDRFLVRPSPAMV